jgi:hypothetical protein
MSLTVGHAPHSGRIPCRHEGCQRKSRLRLGGNTVSDTQPVDAYWRIIIRIRLSACIFPPFRRKRRVHDRILFCPTLGGTP